MKDQFVSFCHDHKRIHERLNHIEGRLEHMEGHVHEDFYTPLPPGYGTENPTLRSFLDQGLNLDVFRYLGYSSAFELFSCGLSIYFYCWKCVSTIFPISLIWMGLEDFYFIATHDVSLARINRKSRFTKKSTI